MWINYNLKNSTIERIECVSDEKIYIIQNRQVTRDLVRKYANTY